MPRIGPGLFGMTMMSDDIFFDCPHCGQFLDADTDMKGEEVHCPACGRLLMIPACSTAPDADIRALEETERRMAEEGRKSATARIELPKPVGPVETPYRNVAIKRPAREQGQGAEVHEGFTAKPKKKGLFRKLFES